LEIGAMNILHQLRAAYRRSANVRELSRLDDRTLADIGIDRADIRRVAARAARLPSSTLADDASGESPAAAPAPVTFRPLTPAEMNRIVLEAQRMRAEAIGELVRGVGRALARLVRPPMAAPARPAAELPSATRRVSPVGYGQAWG
jgi:uncharacterized protein YjiS (DUF1127 family)